MTTPRNASSKPASSSAAPPATSKDNLIPGVKDNLNNSNNILAIKR